MSEKSFEELCYETGSILEACEIWYERHNDASFEEYMVDVIIEGAKDGDEWCQQKVGEAYFEPDE